MKIGPSHSLEYVRIRSAPERRADVGVRCTRCLATIQSEVHEDIGMTFEAVAPSAQRNAIADIVTSLTERMAHHVCLPGHLKDLRKRVDFAASENEQLEALMNAIAERLAATSRP